MPPFPLPAPSPLYEVHDVKRYPLLSNAVCWTKSGSASRLSGRRLAAPPCIRSALAGDLTTIPRAWANARPGERDLSLQRDRPPLVQQPFARPPPRRSSPSPARAVGARAITRLASR